MTTWYKISRRSGLFLSGIKEVQVKAFTSAFIRVVEPDIHPDRPDMVRRYQIHTEHESYFPTKEEAIRTLQLIAQGRLKAIEKEKERLEHFLEIKTGRTDEEVVKQTNELARTLYQLRGYGAGECYSFASATHPHEKEAWAGACAAQQLLMDTDPNDALDNLNE